jgi:molybdopterin synthase catalytic subunit
VKIEIRDQPFDPWQELSSYQQTGSTAASSYGATALFVGTMRDFNEGDRVHGMTLEHYPGMTEKHLEAICHNATSRYNLLDALVIHRVGPIQPGEPIVLVAVWSVHRAAAFDACRLIMDDLKSKAPFWKKEELDEGKVRWVDHNT